MKLIKELLNNLEVRNSIITLSIFDISYHFVPEQVKQNTISVKYCPSESMIADIMTKGLHKVTFEQLRDKLGVVKIK